MRDSVSLSAVVTSASSSSSLSSACRNSGGYADGVARLGSRCGGGVRAPPGTDRGNVTVSTANLGHSFLIVFRHFYLEFGSMKEGEDCE